MRERDHPKNYYYPQENHEQMWTESGKKQTYHQKPHPYHQDPYYGRECEDVYRRPDQYYAPKADEVKGFAKIRKFM